MHTSIYVFECVYLYVQTYVHNYCLNLYIHYMVKMKSSVLFCLENIFVKHLVHISHPGPVKIFIIFIPGYDEEMCAKT